MAINGKDLAGMIDATVLGKDASKDDLINLANMAKKYGFFSCAFAFPTWVSMMAEQLKGSGVGIIGGAASLQGNEPVEIKKVIAQYHIDNGCTEMENFINLSWFKSGMYKEVVNDIRTIRDMVPNMIYKVILETPFMSNDEITTACQLCIDGGVDFVKTGTGQWGATTFEQVETMANACKGKAKIKVSGGVRTIEQVDRYLELGTARFGVSLPSAIKLVEEADKR